MARFCSRYYLVFVMGLLSFSPLVIEYVANGHAGVPLLFGVSEDSKVPGNDDGFTRSSTPYDVMQWAGRNNIGK